MTQDAQSALRRIMETYSTITRFCLVCNYVTRFVPSFPPFDLALPFLPYASFEIDALSVRFLWLGLRRIIEPLASRCSKFRFRALDINSTEDRLRKIAEAEQVLRDDGVRTSVPDPGSTGTEAHRLFSSGLYRSSSSSSSCREVTSVDR
jgi:replication factor C subunit 2/4